MGRPAGGLTLFGPAEEVEAAPPRAGPALVRDLRSLGVPAAEAEAAPPRAGPALVRDLRSLGVPAAEAEGFTVPQAHAVLRRLRAKRDQGLREAVGGGPVLAPDPAATGAGAESPPAAAGGPGKSPAGWSYPEAAAAAADLRVLLAGDPGPEALRRAAWGAVAYAGAGLLRKLLAAQLRELESLVSSSRGAGGPHPKPRGTTDGDGDQGEAGPPRPERVA